MASVVHPVTDIGASIASGSFRTEGMVIIPCSIHTVGAVAHCISDTLLTRAADVCLKEGRRLVLVVRETPLHIGHLRTLVAAAESGAMIVPPVPAFYSRPTTLTTSSTTPARESSIWSASPTTSLADRATRSRSPDD